MGHNEEPDKMSNFSKILPAFIPDPVKNEAEFYSQIIRKARNLFSLDLCCIAHYDGNKYSVLACPKGIKDTDLNSKLQRNSSNRLVSYLTEDIILYIEREKQFSPGERNLLSLFIKSYSQAVQRYHQIESINKLDSWLAETFESYQELIDLSPDATFIHFEDEILLINYLGARLLGAQKPSEVIGRKLTDFVHFDSRDIFTRQSNYVRKERRKSDPASVKFIRLDGQTVDVQVNSVPIKYKGQEAFLTSVCNVLGEMETEYTPVEAQEDYHLVGDRKDSTQIEGSIDATYIFDVESKQIIHANHNFLQLTGYDIEEIKLRTIFDILEHDAEEIETYLDELLKKDVQTEGERKWVRKDGSIINVHETLSKYKGLGKDYILVTARYIVDRKKSAATLKIYEQAITELSAIRKALTLNLNSEIIFQGIIESVQRIFHSKSSAIFLYNSQDERFSVVAYKGFDKDEIEEFETLPANRGIIRRAIRNRRSVYIPDVTRDSNHIKISNGVGSEIALPLIVADEIVGVIYINHKRFDAFDESTINILSHFADYAAIAIANARLKEQSQRHVHEISVIQSIINLATREISFKEIAQETSRIIKEQMQYQSVSIYLTEKTDSHQILRLICISSDNANSIPVNYTQAFGEGVVGFVGERGEPIIIPDVAHDERYLPVKGRITKSVLCVPIKKGDAVIGVINIESSKRNAFQKYDLQTITVVASHLATVYERSQLNEHFRELQIRYMDLYENAPDMYFTIDEDGTILNCNTAVSKVLGYVTNEIVGRKLQQIVSPEYLKEHQEAFKTVRKIGTLVDFKCRLIDKKSKPRDVLINAVSRVRPDGQLSILTVIHDLTEEQKTGYDLHRYAHIFSQTSDNVFITDINGVIEYVNPAFETITGYTKEEIIGRTPRFLKSGKHSSEFYKKLWDTILSGQVFSDIFVNKKKNGELFSEKKTITPIFDRDNRIINFISTGKILSSKKVLDKQ